MIVTLQTPEEKLAGLPKPSLHSISQLDLASDDWLIVCAGFEERSLESLKKVVLAESSFKVMMILYEPFLAENKAASLRQLCLDLGANLVETTYDRRNPAGFGSTILEALASSSGRIFIDVSSMSRLLIVQTLVAVGTRPKGFSDCFVIYTEAETYPPSEAEAEAELTKSGIDPTLSILFLSSGVFEVTVVPELSSFAPAPPQSRLIIFPSLDAHQLISLRNELQPSRFTFIEGLPPSADIQWRKKLVSRINHLETFGNAERYSASTLQYEETLDRLLEIYSRHSIRERLIISPTGSKMQTVAVGIFRSFIEDVQIVYPTPHNFRSPDGYTLGASTTHLLCLSDFAVNTQIH